jgi:hypothetical protein
MWSLTLPHTKRISGPKKFSLFRPSCYSRCLNQRPVASLRQQFVECSVYRVHFGPRHRVDDDGGRMSSAMCPSTGSRYPVVVFSRHQHERAPAMACDLDSLLASGSLPRLQRLAGKFLLATRKMEIERPLGRVTLRNYLGESRGGAFGRDVPPFRLPLPVSRYDWP